MFTVFVTDCGISPRRIVASIILVLAQRAKFTARLEIAILIISCFFLFFDYLNI